MVIDIIKNRRSIRKYKETPVSKEQMLILLEAAMMAPSACNTRPWRFIAITNREMLNKLADVHPYAKMLFTAQAAIVILALPKAQEGVQDDLPKGFFPQDCGAVTENILLQAESMGLGSCWCGVYPKEGTSKAVKEALGLDGDDLPFGIIAIGEKDESPSPRGQYEEEKVTWIE
jgi:nitroreductase